MTTPAGSTELPTPSWQPAEAGVRLRISAVRLHIAALAWTIVGIVLAGGAVSAAVLILVSDALGIFLARSAVIAASAAVGMACYGLFALTARARSRVYEVTIAGGCLGVRGGGMNAEWPLSELRELRWQRSTDYARLEFRTRSFRVSLMTGIARPLAVAGVRLQGLPPLPPEATDQFERAGLMRRDGSRSPTLTTYRR